MEIRIYKSFSFLEFQLPFPAYPTGQVTLRVIRRVVRPALAYHRNQYAIILIKRSPDVCLLRVSYS